MNEENSKAKLVRDYGKSDSWKAIESQFNTVADEEAVFEAINEEGRSHEAVKSELDRVREWYNVMGLLRRWLTVPTSEASWSPNTSSPP